MKRSWVPAALMGTLALGYLAGSGRRGSGEGAAVYDPPPASSSEQIPPPVAQVDSSPVEPRPEPVPAPATDGRWGEYPPWNGVDLDCSDIGHPVRVSGPDPHRLDKDGNGIGCESY